VVSLGKGDQGCKIPFVRDYRNRKKIESHRLTRFVIDFELPVMMIKIRGRLVNICSE